jgi:preprotein translocase subunit SecA
MDAHWREHLAALDHLRQGIHLRGYAQKNPKQEYKREAFELFGAMIESVKLEIVKTLTNVQYGEKPPEIDDQQHVENVRAQHGEFDEPPADANGGDVAIAEAATKKRPVSRAMPKVGRNDPCPCGSGKKFKHCHGKLS